jgi:hypothetical protein
MVSKIVHRRDGETQRKTENRVHHRGTEGTEEEQKQRRSEDTEVPEATEG